LAVEHALPVEVPVLAVEPVDSPEARVLVERAHEFDGVVFTSQNGVKGFSEFVRYGDLPRVFAVGPSTAAAVKTSLGVAAAVPESSYVAESLLKLMLADGVAGKSYLLALAEETRDVVQRGLEAAGATVSVAPIYRSVCHPAARLALLHALGDGLNAVTVASSKTMEFLHRSTPPDLRRRLKRIPLVSIGPITSATAVAMGYEVAAEAETASVESLVDAVKAAMRMP
jgi:uroporphyrinogen-III synthase